MLNLFSLKLSKKSEALRNSNTLKNWIKEASPFAPIYKRWKESRQRAKQDREFPPGSYASPLPNLNEIRRQEEKIFQSQHNAIHGIELNLSKQLDLVQNLKSFYFEVPFSERPKPGVNYYLDNSFYAYADGILLYSMLRHLKPKRVIEVGCGHSSSCMLDTNRLFLNSEVEFIFIDPNPSRLIRLVGADVANGLKILSQPIQDVPLDFFKSLSANDILFIDSSHVSKIASDVNYLFFEIFPILSKGVFIHIHDIFYPFEYPKEWIYAGRAWNECYVVRAFLQYNMAFEIVLFNTYLIQFHSELFQEMPLCLKKPTDPINIPGSLWLRKR